MFKLLLLHDNFIRSYAHFYPLLLTTNKMTRYKLIPMTSTTRLHIAIFVSLNNKQLNITCSMSEQFNVISNEGWMIYSTGVPEHQSTICRRLI